MKEYKYSIIRRESRNPKRNREGRGVSQSDIEALKQELEGNSRGIVSAITDRDLALDHLVATSTDLSERLTTAEGSVQSLGKTLSGQAQALASQAQLLADQGQQLTTQGESLSSQSQRLATAEQALTGKLDSGAFAQWQAGELKQALASKQPKGSYALTSQLATSQQQAVDEAVKRAGEMDKAIKVGGRNLLRDSRREAISKDKDPIATYELADLGEIVEGETYHVKVWATVEGEDNVIRLYNSYHPCLAIVSIEDGVAEATFKWDNYYNEGVPRVGPFNIFRRKGFDGNTDTTITIHKVKLERGTVATDWTPAPEDVAESVSQVNTSLTSLASTLLDPNEGEIHKLTSQLESHKTATAQSFAELSEHPLTIDDNGYWQIWSVKDSKYVTTQYQSRGRDGQNGAKGDKGDTPNLSLDEQCRLVADGKLVSAVSLKGADGQDGAKGADGHTPELSLDSQYRLLADGKLLSQQSLKGRDGEDGAKGADGKDGHTPVIKWRGTKLIIDDKTPVDLRGQQGEAGHTPELHVGEDDYLYIDGVQQRYIRGRQGEPGHNPSPDEVLNTDSFRKQLTSKVTSEVTTQVAPVNQRLESIDDKAEEAHTIGSNAQRTANDMTDQVRLAMSGVSDLKTFQTTATSQLSDLSNRSLTLDQKRDLGYLTFTLKSMTSGSGSNSTLEGLLLQRLIALSGDNQTISAYIASDAMGAVLKAGITGFGTANEREQVEITHQGTGHFGNLYFEGSQIDFKTGRDDAPYLSIGAEEATFIDSFVNNARVIDTPVSVSSVDLTASNAGYQRTLSVDNDGTRLTVTLEKINVAVYGSSKLRLTLDGETLAEWRGSAKYTDTSGHTTDGGSSFIIERTPYEASNLSYERVVRAGNHTVRLEIATPINGTATVNWLRVRRRYDTGAQQSALTKSGLRLFASPDRYFDVDYRKSVLYSAPNVLSTWQSNPYLVRINGGAKVDKLTADELDVPGVPLCGASFNERGGQIKAFGKYVNQRGTNRAQAVYDQGMAAFKVYHSIGHTNYIPIVQVSGWASNDINWSLTPRVYNITSEYFVVRILTNNDNPTARGISYVAYKTM